MRSKIDLTSYVRSTICRGNCSMMSFRTVARHAIGGKLKSSRPFSTVVICGAPSTSSMSPLFPTIWKELPCIRLLEHLGSLREGESGSWKRESVKRQCVYLRHLTRISSYQIRLTEMQKCRYAYSCLYATKTEGGCRQHADAASAAVCPPPHMRSLA